MNRPHQWIAAMIAGVGMLAASGAHATDWPQWRGPNRDSKVVGFTPPAMWPRQLTRRWKITVGLGVASPALVSDKLYVFTRQRGDEVISCLDAATGRLRWQDKYAAQEVNGPADQYAGPRSSPAIAEGKICTLGVSGILSCLDAATGVVVWRKDSGIWPDFYTSTSPLIVEGKCIVHLGGRGKGAVVAYDLASGAEKWKWSGDGPSYSSPVLMTVDGTKLLVTLTESSLIGVRVADGKLLLRVPFHAGTYNMCTPIVYGRTVICAGRAFAIEKEGEGFTARQLWKTDPPNEFNTPVLKDGRLFGLSGRQNIFCVDARTGDVLWTDPTVRGECGAFLDVGSVILALTADTHLVVFKPSGKVYEEFARYKVADTPTYAYPIVVGNRIFVKDHDSLTLWMIK